MYPNTLRWKCIALVQRHPLRAVGITLVAGFLLGRLI